MMNGWLTGISATTNPTHDQVQIRSIHRGEDTLQRHCYLIIAPCCDRIWSNAFHRYSLLEYCMCRRRLSLFLSNLLLYRVILY